MTIKTRAIAAMVSSVATLAALACLGCDGPDAPGPPQASGTLTFNRDIAPIMFAACAPCHRPGESGPFSLLTYRDVKKRAAQIAQVTSTRYMPPWLPEPGEHEFADDRRLPDEQIAAIRQWVREGAVEGDPADLPPTPRWAEGWQLGEPDLVVTMARPYTLAAGGSEVWRNVVIPVPVKATRYVKAVELRPGNKRVVHHSIMQIDRTPASRRLDEQDAELGFAGMDMGQSLPPDGHFIGWTPGRVPIAGIDGMAWRLDRGTDLVLQLHLLPSGKPETIRPRIAFHFADGPPTLHPMALVMSIADIDIPAGTSDYTREDRFVLPVPLEVLGVYPHAHYLGKTIRGFATLPDGTRETLIHIADWDFNWQDDYRYVRPVRLPRGAVLTMRYTYDNSSANPRNPSHPPRRVVSGDRSSDEMGTLTLQVLTVSPAERAQLATAWTRDRVANFPGFARTHNHLGNALVDQGEFEEAIGHYRRALEIEPAYPDARYNLGVALATAGRMDEAIEQFRIVLRGSPDHVEACNNLGNALMRRGRVDEAIPFFHRALELQPYLEQAHYNLGCAHAAAGRTDQAIRHFSRAAQINPGYAMAHNHLGTLLHDWGDLDEAVTSFRQAIAANPAFALAHSNLGLALSSQQRYEEAMTHLRRALQINPKLAVAHAIMGRVLRAQGRLDEAAGHLRQALRLAPNNESVRAELDALEGSKGR